MIYPEHKLL